MKPEEYIPSIEKLYDTYIHNVELAAAEFYKEFVEPVLAEHDAVITTGREWSDFFSVLRYLRLLKKGQPYFSDGVWDAMLSSVPGTAGDDESYQLCDFFYPLWKWENK